MFFFFLMIRRPPRSTLDRSSAASDVYKRQILREEIFGPVLAIATFETEEEAVRLANDTEYGLAVSYTHLRAHETVLDLVCRLLLEKKKNKTNDTVTSYEQTVVQ